MEPEQIETVASDKLCSLTGLTDIRHRQLSGKGFFPMPKKGQWELATTLRGLFRYYREKLAGRGEDIDAERLRKLTEEADLLKLKREEMEGLLVHKSEFLREYLPIFIRMKTRIMASGLSEDEKTALLTNLAKLNQPETTPEISPEINRTTDTELENESSSATAATKRPD